MGLPSGLNYLKWIFSLPAYFLANVGQSCDTACANRNLVCDLTKVKSAAADDASCKAALANSGQTTTTGSGFGDQGDYSGCTYSADFGGHMLMKPNDIELPTCAAIPRVDRQRVCACEGKNTLSMSYKRFLTPASVATSLVPTF